MNVTATSEKQTRDLGKKFAQTLTGGETIGLIGDLGAGKTAFTKGLAAGLGIKKTISSPTFVLMKVYPVKHKTIRHFVHVDAYRIKNAESLKGIGLEDYINSPEAVVIIEWADRVRKILPKGAHLVYFKHLEESLRHITY